MIGSEILENQKELMLMSNRGPRISAGAVLMILAIFVVIVVVGGWLSAKTVPAGSVGVVDTFGQVEDKTYMPGFYWISPLSGMHVMETKTRQYEYADIRRTLTKEGLEAVCDVSVTWHLEPAKVREIYMTVSGEYFDTLITPTFMGILRDEVKRWTAEDIYTGQATQIQNDVQTRLTKEMAPRGIVIESVWLRGTKFDAQVEGSISRKIVAKQDAEGMVFVIQKKKQEAEVAFIDADGKARANERMRPSLTPEILTLNYIDAIKNNQNAIYVPMPMGGNAGSGLSMIMPAPATAAKN
ncbi:MAG: prohibitin family protein [Candidatus Paceibacterota bacterium]